MMFNHVMKWHRSMVVDVFILPMGVLIHRRCLSNRMWIRLQCIIMHHRKCTNEHYYLTLWGKVLWNTSDNVTTSALTSSRITSHPPSISWIYCSAGRGICCHDRYQSENCHCFCCNGSWLFLICKKKNLNTMVQIIYLMLVCHPFFKI